MSCLTGANAIIKSTSGNSGANGNPVFWRPGSKDLPPDASHASGCGAIRVALVQLKYVDRHALPAAGRMNGLCRRDLRKSAAPGWSVMNASANSDTASRS